jgi:hypothetical protein
MTLTAEKLPEFDDMSEAFSVCRERNRPIVVSIRGDQSPKNDGLWHLFPSGNAVPLKKCICSEVNNHTYCLVHGIEEFAKTHPLNKQEAK